MVWTHKGYMHWATEEVEGLILEVKITKNKSHMTAIDSETGEIIANEKHLHPLDAMYSAKSFGDNYGKEIKVG